MGPATARDQVVENPRVFHGYRVPTSTSARASSEARPQRAQFSVCRLSYRFIQMGTELLAASRRGPRGWRQQRTAGGRELADERSDRNTLSPQEWGRVFATCNARTPTGVRDLCSYLLMYRVGLGLREMQYLKCADVNLRERWLRTPSDGARPRLVRLPERPSDLVNVMRDWLGVRDDVWRIESEYFLTSRDGGQLTPRNFSRTLSRRAEKAGVTRCAVSPKVLRNSFALDRLISGHSLAQIQLALGHSSPGSTLVYLDQLRAAANLETEWFGVRGDVGTADDEYVPTVGTYGDRMNFNFGALEVGGRYDRRQLSEFWGYEGHQAVSRKIVVPSGHPLIILFVTLGETNDTLLGSIVRMEGDGTSGCLKRLTGCCTGLSDDVVHLFMREDSRADFLYCGKVGVITADPDGRMGKGYFELVLTPDAVTALVGVAT